MKKFSIITMFLALLTMTAQAQENTYNMVIEMTNGTKITIGPNDIRSLTFNNGELTVTGGDLQTWMESVPKREEMDMILTMIAELERDLYTYLEPLKTEFGLDYYAIGGEVSQKLVEKLNEIQGRLEGSYEEINQLKLVTTEHDEKCQQLQNKIYDIQDMLATLQQRIANLENQ